MTATTHDIESLADLVNLQSPELADVAAAAAREQGGDAAGWAALLRYYRQRQRAHHFDPDAPLCPPRELEQALPKLLAGEYAFVGTTVRFEGEIDWRHIPADLEWHCVLCRHQHWLVLAEAHRQGDERGLPELVRQLHHWHRSVPADFPAKGIVRAIDVGIRLARWMRLFPVIVRAEAFDADALAVMLTQVHRACQSLNAHGAEGYCPDNHGVYEAMGVLQCGVYLPELRHADAWRREAGRCLIDRATGDMRPDGAHVEQSTNYHLGMVEHVLTLMKLLTISGDDAPPALRDVAHAMTDWAAAMTRPDGHVTPWGDSHDHDLRRTLARWADELSRPDFAYLASDGREGDAPAWQHRLFPDSGQAVIRSDRAEGDQARWLAFDFGPHGGWHGHYDLLSVLLYAYGQPLTVDLGCHLYDHYWRPLVRSTRMHNTVTVDQRDYAEASSLDPRLPARARLTRSRFEPPLQLLHAWHDGYATPDEPVTVERQVMMLRDRYWLVADRVLARRLHEYHANWHFPAGPVQPMGKWHTDLPGHVVALPRANLAVIPLTQGVRATAAPNWRDTVNRHDEPQWSSLAHAGWPGSRWLHATLLVPFVGEALPLRAVESEAGDDAVRATVAWADGARDTIEARFGAELGTGHSRLNDVVID